MCVRRLPRAERQQQVSVASGRQTCGGGKTHTHTHTYMRYMVHYRGYGVRGRRLARSIRGGGGGAKSARRYTRTTSRVRHTRNRVAETYCCYYIRTFSPPSDKFMACRTYNVTPVISLHYCVQTRVYTDRDTDLFVHVHARVSPRYIRFASKSPTVGNDDVTIQ